MNSKLSQTLFKSDYIRLKHLNLRFNLSKAIRPEVIKDTHRYEELYPYFWQLIDNNIKKCQTCTEVSCYNRQLLIELKSKALNQTDLYLLTYMTTFFLDLIIETQHQTLSTAYYILSQGHDYVFNFVLSPKTKSHQLPNQSEIENYQGYLLSVLYYLLPNFKYTFSPNTII